MIDSHPWSARRQWICGLAIDLSGVLCRRSFGLWCNDGRLNRRRDGCSESWSCARSLFCLGRLYSDFLFGRGQSCFVRCRSCTGRIQVCTGRNFLLRHRQRTSRGSWSLHSILVASIWVRLGVCRRSGRGRSWFSSAGRRFLGRSGRGQLCGRRRRGSGSGRGGRPSSGSFGRKFLAGGVFWSRAVSSVLVSVVTGERTVDEGTEGRGSFGRLGFVGARRRRLGRAVVRRHGRAVVWEAGRRIATFAPSRRSSPTCGRLA